MRYIFLKNLKNKLFFSINDVAQVFKIKPRSSWVLCNRYVKKGIFIRLKKGFYTLEQNFDRWQERDFFKLSNFLQVPSYVSFMTALFFYGITTQVPRDFYENASLKRSQTFRIKNMVFNFYKIKKKYYFDFVKIEDFFIATKEKAFVDAVYLYSFGKYKFDFSSLNLNKLDKKRIKNIIQIYPDKTKSIIKKLCKI